MTNPIAPIEPSDAISSVVSHLMEMAARVGDVHENHGRNADETIAARVRFHAAVCEALAPAREKSEPAPVAQEPATYVIPKSVANAFTGKEREAWEHGFKWACSIVQPRAAAPTATQGLSDAEITTIGIAHFGRGMWTWLEETGRAFARAILSAAQETKP